MHLKVNDMIDKLSKSALDGGTRFKSAPLSEPRDLAGRLKEHWLSTVVTVVIATAATTWGFFHATIETPLRDEIRRKSETISNLKSELDILRKMQNPTANSSTVGGDTSAEILMPHEGDRVSSYQFLCQVELGSPLEGKRYYLASELDGKHWPVQEIHPLPHRGRIQVLTDISNMLIATPRASYTFFILIYQVEETEHQRIQQWFKGPATGMNFEGKQLARRTINFVPRR
jgi:hypothetical protein